MNSKNTRLSVAGTLAFVLTVLAWGDVEAQDRNRDFGYHGFGPRVGFSTGPEQIVLGGHVDLGEPFPAVRFQPNLEIGFGDDVTVLTIDADFHYRFTDNWDVWSPYLGGGVGTASWSYDDDGVDDNEVDDGTEVQLHIVGGIEKYISAGKFFVESKIGLVSESPDLKFLAGWTFVQ